ETGHLVDLLGDGDTLLHVLELHGTRVLGDDRTGERIPGRQLQAGLDGMPILDQQGRAVRDLVAFTLAAVVVGDHHLAGTRNDDRLALGTADVAHRRSEAGDTVGLGLDRTRDSRP